MVLETHVPLPLLLRPPARLENNESKGRPIRDKCFSGLWPRLVAFSPPPLQIFSNDIGLLDTRNTLIGSKYCS